MKSASPIPWRVEQLPTCPDEWAICAPTTAAVGRNIGTLDAKHPEAHENRRLLLQAVNNHAALLSALRDAIPLLDWLVKETKEHPDIQAKLATARQAVRDAEGW